MRKRTSELIEDNIFAGNDVQLSEAPSNVAQAMKVMNIMGPEFDAIRQACKDLKVTVNCPGYVGNSAVHFTFPDYKFAICYNTNQPKHRLQRKVLDFENAGWRLTILMPKDTLKLGPLRLLEQLGKYLKQLEGNK